MGKEGEGPNGEKERKEKNGRGEIWKIKSMGAKEGVITPTLHQARVATFGPKTHKLTGEEATRAKTGKTTNGKKTNGMSTTHTTQRQEQQRRIPQRLIVHPETTRTRTIFKRKAGEKAFAEHTQGARARIPERKGAKWDLIKKNPYAFFLF